MKREKTEIPHFTIRFKHSSDEEDVFVVDNHGIILSGGKNKMRKRAPKRNLNKEIMQLSKDKGVIDDSVDLNIQKPNMADNDNINQFYDSTCINPFITYNNQPGIFVPIYSAPQVIYPGPSIIQNQIPNTPFVYNQISDHPFLYNQIPNTPILITKAPNIKQDSNENSSSNENSDSSDNNGNNNSNDNNDKSNETQKMNENIS